MSLPAGCKLEIGIGAAGAFVDVSADVDSMASVSTQFGRQSEFSAPNAAPFSVTLDNSSTCSTGQGSYTPGRQVLYDGTTVHPYYPRIIPRIPIRFSYTISGTPYYRFTGFIKSWQPIMVNGMVPRVVIQAADVLDRLSRVTLQSTILQEYLVDSPSYLWPMTDAVGATTAVEASGNNGPELIGTPLPTFGSDGPGVGDGTGILVVSSGQHLAANITPPAGAYTVEFFVNMTSYPSNFVEFFLSGALGIGLSAAGLFGGPAGYSATTMSLSGWHHCALTVAANLSCVLYLDAVAVTTSGAGTSVALSPSVDFGDAGNFSTSGLSMNMGYAAIYNTQLSATRIAAHAAAGLTYYGDTTGARIARMLGIAGLTSANWNLDTGVALVGSYPQGGKTILQVCQDMATTEGGGAVFYATPDGRARFADRNFRNSTTVAATFDAGADFDGGTFLPSIDDLTLVNAVTVSRSDQSSTLSTQTASNAASLAANLLFASSVTSYATTDVDALNLAQYMVATQATPQYRLPQVAIDLMTATTAGLYVSVAGIEIGDRIRLTSLDAAAAPRSSMDFIVEGWAETITADSYTITFDISPADNPPRWKWDTSRWAPIPGDATLNATITSAATSLAIAWVLGPKFTTTSGSYPLSIKIDEEVIVLNGVPGGSTSPQSYTGVTRGASGTIAAAHWADSVISLYPAYAWQL